ncbi:MAG TPA: acetylxylan esterase [Bryobacteraceae bacterium]|nr:acetylxylan esterase [Bryobacteraceae bacterium]
MSRTIVLLILCAVLAQAQNVADLDFTSAIGDLRDISQDNTRLLISEAERYLAVRPTLQSEAGVKARAAQVREQILKNIGGLPEKTPLNARTVGVLDRGKYRIEKVIFESQPRFYVTANLYIPNGSNGPFPAILFPLGHEAGAKAHEAWQYVLGSFASKGFVALAWDPLGQGERSQFYDADMRGSKLLASTREHTMLGVQCLLTGDSIARYAIHDGIRALDYLVSRKEVDASRIGVTGNSGGGTLTTYLAALDDRLKVAAPSCYITSWKSLLTQLGPQDAEQNLPPWLSAGFDFPDLIYAFGLKPYLVLSAIRDFFPIGGARATFAEAKRVYGQAGAGDRIGMVEADDGHGYTRPRRLAAYAWMSKWLANRQDDGIEPDIQLATEEELQCTATGQVLTSLGGETVYSLNRSRASRAGAVSPAREKVLAVARALTRYAPANRQPAVTGYGVLPRNGYRIEKLTYESEPGMRIPAVLAIPAARAAGAPGVVIADCAGKSAAAARIEKLANEGKTVLAIDIRGCGELAAQGPRGADPWFGDARNTSAALLLGRTMLGMRAMDITAGIDVLAERADLGVKKVTALGVGPASMPMLFAAAFDSRITAVDLDGLLYSFRAAVESRLHRRVYEHVLPGVLGQFDVEDVIRAVGPRPVRVRRFVDAMGETKTRE